MTRSAVPHRGERRADRAAAEAESERLEGARWLREVEELAWDFADDPTQIGAYLAERSARGDLDHAGFARAADHLARVAGVPFAVQALRTPGRALEDGRDLAAAIAADWRGERGAAPPLRAVGAVGSERWQAPPPAFTRPPALHHALQAKPDAAGLRATGLDAPLALRGGGEPLSDELLARYEAAFGEDLSDVRLHRASAEAVALGATAFACGDAIHFAPGRFDPDTESGLEVLGHELTHVLQQRAGRVSVPAVPGVHANTDPALEREADHLGARAARGEAARVPGGAAATRGPAVQYEGGKSFRSGQSTGSWLSSRPAIERAFRALVATLEQGDGERSVPRTADDIQPNPEWHKTAITLCAGIQEEARRHELGSNRRNWPDFVKILKAGLSDGTDYERLAWVAIASVSTERLAVVELVIERYAGGVPIGHVGPLAAFADLTWHDAHDLLDDEHTRRGWTTLKETASDESAGNDSSAGSTWTLRRRREVASKATVLEGCEALLAAIEATQATDRARKQRERERPTTQEGLHRVTTPAGLHRLLELGGELQRADFSVLCQSPAGLATLTTVFPVERLNGAQRDSLAEALRHYVKNADPCVKRILDDESGVGRKNLTSLFSDDTMPALIEGLVKLGATRFALSRLPLHEWPERGQRTLAAVIDSDGVAALREHVRAEGRGGWTLADALLERLAISERRGVSFAALGALAPTLNHRQVQSVVAAYRSDDADFAWPLALLEIARHGASDCVELAASAYSRYVLHEAPADGASTEAVVYSAGAQVGASMLQALIARALEFEDIDDEVIRLVFSQLAVVNRLPTGMRADVVGSPDLLDPMSVLNALATRGRSGVAASALLVPLDAAIDARIAKIREDLAIYEGLVAELQAHRQASVDALVASSAEGPGWWATYGAVVWSAAEKLDSLQSSLMTYGLVDVSFTTGVRWACNAAGGELAVDVYDDAETRRVEGIRALGPLEEGALGALEEIRAELDRIERTAVEARFARFTAAGSTKDVDALLLRVFAQSGADLARYGETIWQTFTEGTLRRVNGEERGPGEDTTGEADASALCLSTPEEALNYLASLRRPRGRRPAEPEDSPRALLRRGMIRSAMTLVEQHEVSLLLQHHRDTLERDLPELKRLLDATGRQLDAYAARVSELTARVGDAVDAIDAKEASVKAWLRALEGAADVSGVGDIDKSLYYVAEAMAPLRARADLLRGLARSATSADTLDVLHRGIRHQPDGWGVVATARRWRRERDEVLRLPGSGPRVSVDLDQELSVDALAAALGALAREPGERGTLAFKASARGQTMVLGPLGVYLGGWARLELSCGVSDTLSYTVGVDLAAAVQAGLTLGGLVDGGYEGGGGASMVLRFKSAEHVAGWLFGQLQAINERLGVAVFNLGAGKAGGTASEPVRAMSTRMSHAAQANVAGAVGAEARTTTKQTTFYRGDEKICEGQTTTRTWSFGFDLGLGAVKVKVSGTFSQEEVSGDANRANDGHYRNLAVSMEISPAGGPPSQQVDTWVPDEAAHLFVNALNGFVPASGVSDASIAGAFRGLNGHMRQQVGVEDGRSSTSGGLEVTLEINWEKISETEYAEQYTRVLVTPKVSRGATSQPTGTVTRRNQVGVEAGRTVKAYESIGAETESYIAQMYAFSRDDDARWQRFVASHRLAIERLLENLSNRKHHLYQATVASAYRDRNFPAGLLALERYFREEKDWCSDEEGRQGPGR